MPLRFYSRDSSTEENLNDFEASGGATAESAEAVTCNFYSWLIL